MIDNKYIETTSLSAEKLELLTYLLEEEGIEFVLTQKISPRVISKKLPLSFAQQRLWFLNQLEPDSPVYNIPVAFHLSGSLNLPALQDSFNEVIRRHEVLRTTFAVVDGEPVQIIAPQQVLTIKAIDLRELASLEREAIVQQLVTEEAQQPFDLTKELLLRSTLLHIDEAEYVLLFVMHHIVSDGWSMDVLVREVVVLYECFTSGQSSPLPELPIQYADYAIWQRQWLQDNVLETQLGYWKQQLGGCLPVLELPTDRPRPNKHLQQLNMQTRHGASLHSFSEMSNLFTFEGATQSFKLLQEVSIGLKNLSQQEDTTLFMTLLAAFKTLLFRYTGTADILVGSPIANRNRTEIEGLIGFFVNILVLRTDLSGNPTFRELLGRVREVTLGAYAHQDLPFDWLVEELQPQRDLSHTPLFQVMFDLQNAPMSTLELPGLTLSTLDSNTGTTKFDLSLHMQEIGEELVGTLEYNTNLFEANTIRRMAEHLQTLLTAIVTNPEQRVSELTLLTEVERQTLLVQWNETFTASQPYTCIHHLFEAQSLKTPNAVAVVYGDRQFTYRELNARANQLAHYLKQLGVGPEILVGICVERSLEMIIGLLGILKAGGVYVPLDPDYPLERLTFILSDTQIPVLLTQEKFVKELPARQVCMVLLDTDWKRISQESEANPLSFTTPENLAYVIYTSGSTGKPKGVMIQHQSLVNFTETAIVKYGLSECDRILQFASINFDAAAEEIYPCLASGATLVLRNDEMLISGHTFLQKCRNLKLTVLDLPTAYWQQLMSDVVTANLVLPELLRLVIIGGEQALPKQVANWQRYVGNSQELINTYGPTEATVVATIYKLPSLTPANVDLPKLPIGSPINNVQTYVLDKYLQPVPLGVAGELYISGAGLARGYLNRPDLTADKFIPNPFSDRSGARLYKTGDLVRYYPDGNIEFLGRIDDLVKLRGFRIELGEIEAVLSQHPAIQETAINLQLDVDGDKRLVAYVVPNNQQTLSTDDLRNFLKQRLPQYMLPSVFVQLEALPLTPNGKINRKALPVPESIRPELKETFVAPRTAIEAKLADIWAKVLHVEQVGIYDNFFELGGDSILTLQIVAKANQADLHLTPKQLFQYQNIAELAQVCVTAQTTQAEQGLVIGLLPLTPIQHWFFQQNLLELHHYNQAVLLEVHQVLDEHLFKQAIQQLLMHHDALRLRFEQTESGWQQSLAYPDVEVPFTRFDFSDLLDSEQELAIVTTANELHASVNLSIGLLVQVALFNLGSHQPCRLLIIVHHLAVDGISWRVLLEDLQTVYQQLSYGKAIQLPAKTTSFKQWSYGLQEYARSTALQQEKNYWLAMLQKRGNQLPVDYLAGENTKAFAQNVTTFLSVEQTQALLQEVPQAYNTQINDVLLTALVQAFAWWTGHKSLLVDLEGHGRETIFDDVDLSRTVGWFTSIFPILLDLGEVSDPGTALKMVKEQLRGIPNKGIGYGVLRYLSNNLEITKSLETASQAQVLFNYLGQFDQTFSESTLFSFARESSGLAESLRGKRCHLLEINGLVSGGQLRLNWTYSKSLYHQTTIESVAQKFQEALCEIIAHCQSPDSGGYTPSDFPDVVLSEEQLEQALTELELS